MNTPKSNPHSPEFNFDHWSQLAKRDPVAFFAQRRAILDGFIASAPIESQAALRHTQAMVDAARAEAGSPMQAVRMMMGMMADHLDALQGQFEQLRSESDKLGAMLEKARSR